MSIYLYHVYKTYIVDIKRSELFYYNMILYKSFDLPFKNGHSTSTICFIQKKEMWYDCQQINPSLYPFNSCYVECWLSPRLPTEHFAILFKKTFFVVHI